MLNSVSFNPMTSSGILSNNTGSVTVDGKAYPVKKVPYNDPYKCAFAQEYRDVVVINGKTYPIEHVSDRLFFDKTKDVVVIDGKEYDVNNGRFGELLSSLPKLDVIA